MKTNSIEKTTKAPDLNVNAPRSPRVRLGGYAVLPRLLDKCRADLMGLIGDYHTNCALDAEFLSFVGINYDDLRAELAEGKTDGEILQWIEANADNIHTPWEIEEWSSYQDRRSPKPFTELNDYFMGLLESLGKHRTDVRSWADLLDLDDYCSFGGHA